jgi:hypothetical protein
VQPLTIGAGQMQRGLVRHRRRAILVDHAVLHHQLHLGRVGEHGKVVQRVAVDQHDVGQVARLEHAEFVRLASGASIAISSSANGERHVRQLVVAERADGS